MQVFTRRVRLSGEVSTKTGDRLVDDAAQRQAVTNSRITIHSIKRFMGREFDELQEETERVQ